jgi:hypothetical protein
LQGFWQNDFLGSATYLDSWFWQSKGTHGDASGNAIKDGTFTFLLGVFLAKFSTDEEPKNDGVDDEAYEHNCPNIHHEKLKLDVWKK